MLPGSLAAAAEYHMRLGPPGKLRIAQVAPLSESVPPKLYGGTERVVSVLTDELVCQGHAVTLFASGDSQTTATLVPVCEQAQRLAGCVDPLSAHMLMIEQVAQRAKDFDIIHYHVAPLHFPLARRMDTAHLTTMHGRLDLPDLVPLYKEFSELPLVSISDAQRAPLPRQNWVGTVHHGFPERDFRFHPERRGRISPFSDASRARRGSIAPSRSPRPAGGRSGSLRRSIRPTCCTSRMRSRR